MAKHQYRKKKTLSNKKVSAAYEKLLHPTKFISTKLLFQANSNSLHEIGDDDEVETEVNTRDDGQLIVIDGGDDVIDGGDDEALHTEYQRSDHPSPSGHELLHLLLGYVGLHHHHHQ